MTDFKHQSNNNDIIKTKISDILVINPKNSLDDDLDVSFIPMASIQDGYSNRHTSETRKWGTVKSGHMHFREGDIGLAKITPCFENRKSVIFHNLKNGYGAGTTELHILRPKSRDVVLTEYVYWYLKSAEFISEGIRKFTGTAGQVRISKEFVSNFPIPLPPLAEQHRIVAKIEELFAELDRGVADLEKAKAQLKTYRQAVLKSAFENGLNPINIVLHDDMLGNHLTEIKAGKSYTCVEKPPKDNEIGLLNISSVTWGTFNEAESKTCPPDKSLNEDYLVRKGDFLFSRANTLELVGSCVIVDKITKTLMLSDKILRFSFDNLTNKKYILYYLRSPYGRQEIEKYASGNQLSMRNIGQKNIKKIMIPFCSLVEQAQIVSAIESRLSISDSLEKSIDSSLKSAEILRMSILKKAFAGELVPQDPAETSSPALSKENT